MSVRQDEELVYITIRSTVQEPEMISLIGQSRHTVCYALDGFMEGNEQLYRVEKNKFPAGIAQFILFKDGNPVSERLVFIDRKDDLHVDIIPGKEKYGDREKATVQIRVTGSDGQPVEGSFSLSVTDDKTVQPSINSQNIKGTLLLDSDLKGYIESPGWYFSGDEPKRLEALDNLLCTQGWSRFVWDKLETSSVSDFYPVESDFQITGKVIGFAGRPVLDASVILFSKEIIPETATTDKEGRFGFYGFNCPDTAIFVLQSRTKRDRRTLIGFKVDQPGNRHVQTNIIPLSQTKNKVNQTLIEAYTEQAINYINEEGIWTLNLSEVKIEAKRIIDRQPIGFASIRFGGKTLEKTVPMDLLILSLPKPIRYNDLIAPPFPQVIYIVDGMEFDKDGFNDIYGKWPAFMFESIDVVRKEDALLYYDIPRGNAAYVFTTKLGTYKAPDASIEIYRPEGYCVRKEFYIPAYEQPEIRQRKTPDFRTTIYWNPVVRTNSSGEAEVSFYTADYTATYSYVLEGIGDNRVVVSK